MVTKNLHNKIINGDSLKELKKIPDETFDIIFADPPYNFDIKKYELIIDKIFKSKIINNNGLLVIEHSNKIELNRLKKYHETRKYGGCFFTFFKNIKD